MKAQCEKCGESVELAFAPAAGGIEVSCPACQRSYFVPSATPEATAPPRPGGDEQECPKCGLVQARAQACRRCGLVFVRWKGAASELADDAAEAAALWAACEERWDEPARHDAFIACCQRTAQFPFAAGRYRAAQLARGAAAEPVAARALERIEKLALHALTLSSTRAPTGKRVAYRAAAALLVVTLLLVIGGLVWGIFYQHDRAVREERSLDGVAPVLPAPVHDSRR